MANIKRALYFPAAQDWISLGLAISIWPVALIKAHTSKIKLKNVALELINQLEMFTIDDFNIRLADVGIYKNV